MAGGKETPRQKMIGMMYLVLTALLALQVSSSVLEKFIVINRSLEHRIKLQIEVNNETVKRILKTVKESGSRDNDINIYKKSLEIRKETDKVLDFINSIKAELKEMTGGVDKKGIPKGIKDTSAVARIMIDEDRAEKLKQILNGHMQYLSYQSGNKYDSIALDASENEIFQNDPNQEGKDFAHLNFESTPLGAALATLSEFNSKVIHTESDALELLARTVGADDVKFDRLFPLVRPESNIVAAGTKYRAEMFLSAASSGIDPSMLVDGRIIPVKDGAGEIVFTATPGAYNSDGLARKIFKAIIKLKLPGGKESTLVKDVEYFVAKPVIQVQSAAVQALYLNCGNDLNIQVPAMGSSYNPTFKATGARLVTGGGKGLVTVIPEANEVDISVYSSNNLLGTQKFKVRTIPKPDILITSHGKKLDEKQGMDAPGPRSLEVSVIPDESFKLFLPKDARYRVANWEISLARGARALKTQKGTKKSIDLSEFAEIARPGDRLIIEIKQIERRNFKEEVEQVKFGNFIRTIPLN